MQREEIDIVFDLFEKLGETTHQEQGKKYEIYNIPYFTDPPNDTDYMIVESNIESENSQKTIFQIGHTELEPITPSRDEVNKKLESKSCEQFSEKQWETVLETYTEFVRTTFRNGFFNDSQIDIYQNFAYVNLSDFSSAFRFHLENIHEKINREIKYEEYDSLNSKKSDVKSHEGYECLSDEQVNNIDVLEEVFEFESVNIESNPNLVTKLIFTRYDEWQYRTIEHIHNGVFYNKTELAKTKSLLEEGLSQKDIREKLDKSASTVSRQVSTVKEWERRAEWTTKQLD